MLGRCLSITSRASIPFSIAVWGQRQEEGRSFLDCLLLADSPLASWWQSAYCSLAVCLLLTGSVNTAHRQREYCLGKLQKASTQRALSNHLRSWANVKRMWKDSRSKVIAMWSEYRRLCQYFRRNCNQCAKTLKILTRVNRLIDSSEMMNRLEWNDEMNLVSNSLLVQLSNYNLSTKLQKNHKIQQSATVSSSVSSSRKACEDSFSSKIIVI